VFDRARRPAIARSVATIAPPEDDRASPADEGVRSTCRGAHRSSRLVIALLIVVGTSACESSTVAGLNVRAAPTTASRVVGKLSSAGMSVHVECFTRGQAIHGQTMWYLISEPRRGYVTAYYVRADSDTTATHC